MTQEEQRLSFIEKLNNVHHWPEVYTFKFIGTPTIIDKVKAKFKADQWTIKASSKGKFISITIRQMMPNAEEVLAIYDDVKKIKGVIAL